MKPDEKKCPRCAEVIKREAVACRHCGYSFPIEEIEAEQKKMADQRKRAGRLLGGLGAAVVALIAIGQCSSKPSPEAAKQEAEASALADSMENQADAMDAMANQTAAAANAEPQTLWSYSASEDKMRGGKGKTASLSSSNEIRLDFPYGATTPVLHVRQDPKFGTDVYITSEGQPLCRQYRDDTLSVKFDSGRIKRYACAESADGSSGVVFFTAGRKLISEIKRAKKMVVEIDYYDNGRQQIEFPVAGLKWG